MLFKNLALLAAVGLAAAQMRPDNVTICDYYTTALLKDNTAANQLKLLTLVVNTAVIGNYTKPNVGISVPGILAPGMYNGTMVNLLPYFNGGLMSTNNGGKSGESANFLDDGGAVPLTMNMPANGTTSNQYMLLTHLYQFFGVLAGCTLVGQDGYPAYAGEASMYEVHKFMVLDSYQLGYFITQVGLSAASFGVTQADATALGMALNKLFNYRCSPATTVIKAQGPQLQSTCTDAKCATDPNATCNAYDNNGAPYPAPLNTTTNSTSMSNSTSTSASSPSSTSSSTAPPASATKSDATALQAGLFAVVIASLMAALSL